MLSVCFALSKKDVSSEEKERKARGTLRREEKVGATRFERATLCSQSRCASQAALRPDSPRERISNGWIILSQIYARNRGENKKGAKEGASFARFRFGFRRV